ncbi:hypothetical protein [Cellvibrio sp. PSBB006]|uniref:hypothetical protein n=1 Tax=Cellvibrio sp. PSBB006 TaxID=1987723 RepID=UPI000B3B4F62|nr:hypothetical protein [Cellvibrio sp. PSBB006]ARU28179.1 hypothetical protein CBR65_12505 [Cellvibrio sp. PSBB006]
MVSLFEHPDSKEFLERTYSLLMKEADRGCVLLGVSLLDEELTKMFKSLIPINTSGKRMKEIFDGKGAFGSLSAKLDIAYVCRLLPSDLINCIHSLRGLRNNLAHQASPFSIEENLERVYEIFSRTNDNLTAGMAHLSGEFIYDQFIEKIMNTNDPTDESKRLFNSKEEAIAYLRENDDVQKTLFEQRIKSMFVIGIASLGASIVFHREKSKAKFAEQA